MLFIFALKLFLYFLQHDKADCIQLNAEVLFLVIVWLTIICSERLGGNIQKKKLEKALEMLRNENPQD